MMISGTDSVGLVWDAEECGYFTDVPPSTPVGTLLNLIEAVAEWTF